jgi:osmoprotectant transport system permease protein
MKKGILLLGTFVLAGALLLGCSGKKEKAIVVGSANYTEQDILGNVLQILLRENTGLKVDYKSEMSSSVLFAALKSGDVDVVVEYTGSVYAHYLGHSELKSADEVYAIAVEGVKDQFKLLMLGPLGFNNTYTLSVRNDTVEKYGLATYSDVAKIPGELVLGAGFEIFNRNDGIPNLKKVYGITFKDEKALDGNLRYVALENDESQITDAFATDGLLQKYGLTVLEDDKHFFPPYHAAIIVRQSVAEKYPEIQAQLDRLAGLLPDDVMRNMNYKVDVLNENPVEVARAFLTANGLI